MIHYKTSTMVKQGNPRNPEQILENELLHSDIRQVVSSLGLQQAEGWPSQLESNRELILGGLGRKIGTIWQKCIFKCILIGEKINWPSSKLETIMIHMWEI